MSWTVAIFASILITIALLLIIAFVVEAWMFIKELKEMKK